MTMTPRGLVLNHIAATYPPTCTKTPLLRPRPGHLVFPFRLDDSKSTFGVEVSIPTFEVEERISDRPPTRPDRTGPSVHVVPTSVPSRR